MTVRCDEDILLAKVATVRRCVATIRRLWWEGQPPVEDWVRLDVTVLNLQRAVEACVDLANHLIAANAWGLPGSASESMQLLVEHGILTPTDLPIYRSMIGFRNIAVETAATSTSRSSLPSSATTSKISKDLRIALSTPPPRVNDRPSLGRERSGPVPSAAPARSWAAAHLPP